MFGHIVTAEAGTDAFKHRIHIFIVQRFIDLYRYISLLHNTAHSRNPLEISVMRYEQHNAAMFLDHGKVLFLIVIFHAPAEFLERHAQHLHLLQHIIADITIEPAFYIPQFRLGLFGKCMAQISAYHSAPIVHDVMHQKAKPVG